MKLTYWIKRYKVLVLVVAALLAFNLIFLFASPRQIVETVGVDNSYLVTFSIATVGGVSTLTGAALYTTIATFSAGGATPWLLGIAGGIGIFISNSAFFLLAGYGRRSVPNHWQERLRRWSDWICERVSERVQLGLAFLYLGFSPFPDDILMVALVLAGFTYRQVAPVLLCAGLSVATLTAYLGTTLFQAITGP